MLELWCSQQIYWGNCRFRRKGIRKVGILKQKYKNNKQNTQMQMSSEPKRKRKGISVSLTPDKKWEQGPRGLSPSVPPVRIQQSQVRIQQSQVRILQPTVFQPQPIRVFESVRPVDSRVTFNYTTNASKEQQIRQSQILNQQLLHLHRQIQNKKNTIQVLQQQNLYASSRTNQEKILPVPSNIAPITQIPIVNNSRSSWNPCPCIQPQTPANYEQHIQIGPKNPQNMNEFKQATKKHIQNETSDKPDCKVYLSQTLKQIKPSQILKGIKNNSSNQERKDQNYCLSDRNTRGLEINKIVEIKTVQSCQGQESSRIRYDRGSPEKIVNVDIVNSIEQVTKDIKKQQKLKQNQSQSQTKKQARKNRQKLEKLRWAEQKLLEIIKVCNNGL